MGTITLGNPQEKALANQGAAWAIAVVIVVLLGFAVIGINNRGISTGTTIDSLKP